MAKEVSREQKLKYIFSQHPNIKELNVTSDDQTFTQERDAINHAQTLKDKEIVLAKRSEYVNHDDSEDSADNEVDRDALFAKHLELFGKAPAKTAKTETIVAKIADEEAKRANSANSDTTTGGEAVGKGEDDGKGEGVKE